MSKKEFNSLKYLIDAKDLKDNPEQMLVYNSTGNCVVLAGPGSGKTKTITIKMARMLDEDIREPQGIACITYNKECARELKLRLKNLGIYQNKRVFIDTVHSFCLKHVIKPFAKLAKMAIPEPIKVASVSKQDELWEKSFNLTIGKRERLTNGWKNDASVYRRSYLDRDSYEWKTKNSELVTWIENYERLLRDDGFIDFDDMVLLGLKIVEQNSWAREILNAKFPVLIVDEYQDLGIALHQIVQYLCFKSDIRLIAVGDPDQSIYGFTGANPQLLKDLSKMENVQMVNLKINYRSSEKIVEASQITLGENRGFSTVNHKTTSIISFNEYSDGLKEQAEKICAEIIPDIQKRNPSSRLGDIAILYLNKNDGDIIAEQVSSCNFNYIRIDQNAPYSKTTLNRWIEDCANWCAGGWGKGNPRLYDLINIFDKFLEHSFVSKTEYRFLKGKFLNFVWDNRVPEMSLFEWLKSFYQETLEKLFELSKDFEDDVSAFWKLAKESNNGRLTDFTVASFAGQGGSPEHLNLITLHSAKGLEFTYVIMMGMDQGRIPYRNASESEKNEARRLFYVGFTRAKQEVHLTYSGWYNYYGRIYKWGPSEYIVEIKYQIHD